MFTRLAWRHLSISHSVLSVTPGFFLLNHLIWFYYQSKKMSRGRTIVTIPGGQEGINCCCCRCCTCMDLSIFKREPGIVKLAEIVLGIFGQSLALNFGQQFAGTIGSSFQSYIATGSWCLMTSFLLLVCYVFSPKSYNLLRLSLFETLFNGIAAFTYISSCSYLGWAVNVFLQPLYLVNPNFQAYQAISASYMMGSVIGIVYAYDAYKAYKYFKGDR